MNKAFTILLLAAFPSMAWAADVRVVDGDTIELDGTSFRLHGIDAPEAGQKCETLRGSNWACGKSAVSFIEGLVLDAEVVCEGQEQDGYGRTIAICYADGRDINAEMVRTGHAWAFRRYSEDYVELEERAKAEGVGVWEADTQTPWEYRAEQWTVAVQEAPDGCPIKGNISDNGHIYHAPWSPWYNRTKVSVDQGERWFCDEAQAVQAGWRAPYWGR